MIKATLSSLWIYCLLSLMGACGSNAFDMLEKENPAEEAAKALEQQKPQKAVTIALKALGGSYRALYFRLDASIENGEADAALAALEALAADLISQQGSKIPPLISILSSAHAKIYGIDPFDLALKLATDEEEGGASLASSSSKNELAALFPVLPAATPENINGLTGALIILNSLGSSNFTDADYFKKALYLTANVALVSKQLDTDLDGTISPLEAANLSEGNAQIVLALLLDAALSVGGTGGTGDDSKAASSAAKITAIRDSILSGEGSSESEKVKNYLGSSTRK